MMMMIKIIKEINATKKINEITSKQVLSWVRRVKMQRAQKV